jgi:hypothetical protein
MNEAVTLDEDHALRVSSARDSSWIVGKREVIRLLPRLNGSNRVFQDFDGHKQATRTGPFVGV